MPLPSVPLTDGQLYQICNKAVMPAWAALALLGPKSGLTNVIVMVTALGMAAVYVALLWKLHLEGGMETFWKDVQTLEGLTKALKGNGALLGWLHYLAHDLFVARWLALDGANKRINRLVMLPVLALSMLFGPAGPLAYFVVVRPLFGKSAVTPKGKAAKQPAPAAAPAPQPAKQAAPVAPAPAKNGSATKQAAPAPAKNGKTAAAAAPAPAKNGKAPAAPAPAAAAPAPASSKNGSAKNSSALAAAVAAAQKAPAKKGGKGAAAAPAKAAAPAPKPAPQSYDIEDDRAFAQAAAALLASRAVPKK